MPRTRPPLLLLGLWGPPPPPTADAYPGTAPEAERDGHAAFKAKKYREAASFFELAIAFDGTKAEYYYWASLSHSAAMEDQDAYEWILGALSLDDTDPQYHAQHGRVCLFMGKPGEAAMAFEKALAILPDDGLMWAEYGTVLKNSGHPYQAKEAFEKAVTIDPTLPGIAMELGIVLIDLKDPQQAVGAFRKAVAADARCIECQLALGDALMDCGQAGQALDAYKAVRRLAPDDYRALTRCIRASYGIADYDAAATHVAALQKLYNGGKVYGLSDRQGFVVDEFQAKDLTIQAWEYFEDKAPDGALWSFVAHDPTGWLEKELAVRPGNSGATGSKVHKGCELVELTADGSPRVICGWAATPSYATIKTAVMEEINR